MSTPSTVMAPDSRLNMRYSASSSVLLPLPVRPTTPTFSPFCGRWLGGWVWRMEGGALWE